MNHFSFTRSRKVFFILSAAFLVLGVVCFFVRGFVFDVDFTGGTTVTVSGQAQEIPDAKQAELINAVAKHPGVSVSSFQKTSAVSADDGKTTYGFIMRIQGMDTDTETRQATEKEIRQLLGNANAETEEGKLLDSKYISTSSVSGTVSGELRRAAVIASVIAVALMLVYITVRFDLASGLAAVTCLVHDLFAMLVAYSLFGIPMGSTMIAALLTILGYSINATIIIFDRVRENRKQQNPDGTARLAGFDETVDRSVKETMKRSVFTSLTTLVTIGVLYVASRIGNIPSVTNFALPLIVGIIAGFYSSVCLSGNLWCVYSRLFGKRRRSSAPQSES